MAALIGPLRWIHILAGVVALVVAPGAMLTVKGGRAPRRWGKIYFWLMAVVALTAVVLGLWRPVTFLVLVAVFSFYAAFTGSRVLGRKRPDRGARPAPLDWLAAGVTLAASLALLGLGFLPRRRHGRPGRPSPSSSARLASRSPAGISGVSRVRPPTRAAGGSIT